MQILRRKDPELDEGELATSHKYAPLQALATIPSQVSSVTLQKIEDLSLFWKKGFFSSQKFYHVTRISLLSLSCFGILMALGFLVRGMPGAALATSALAMANLMGSFMAYQVSIQKGLEDNLAHTKETLIHMQQVLSEYVQRFATEAANLQKGNEALRIQTVSFERENQLFQESHQALAQKMSFFLEELSQDRQFWKTSASVLTLRQEIRSALDPIQRQLEAVISHISPSADKKSLQRIHQTLYGLQQTLDKVTA